MRKDLYYRIFVLTIFFLVELNAIGQVINTTDCKCDYIVQPNVEFLNADTLNVGPGDVVCVVASKKRYLGFINFHGAPGNPITFVNCGGQVVIKDTDWYYGIKFDNCSYFRFTGTGNANYKYGFLIDGTPPQIAGLGIAKMSTDFEVDHIEVSRTGFAGIIAKSDPDCTGEPNRGNFVQRNTIIHDNYIHNTGGEGIYIGFPHYRGIKRKCGNDSLWVYPHDLVGVRIYNNTIHYSGKEGIQLGCATADAEIYDNSIMYFGQNNSKWQWAGIQLSTGTTGKLFRNSIATGTGPGIWLNGLGDNYIYNNIIQNVGSSGQDGIMIYDSLVADGKAYYIINNTIVNSGGYGMKVYTDKSTRLTFCNNVVAGVGNELTSVPSPVQYYAVGNVMEADANNLYFEDYGAANYRLKAISPAVDAGEDMSSYGVIFDYENIARPRGKAFDAGAFESPHERMMVGFFIYPNPVLEEAHIVFVVPEDTEGSLKIFDLHGREVAIIAKGRFIAATEYKFDYNAFFLAQGIYYYALEANGETQVKKILVVK
ncbi:MAG: right-handed parallel beta-helix repeat-containing protein [Cytophagaceae bacterium]|nr:right-handed parallel beta-helix repeat-containing protein [Cytophagaceae bacterium]